ncbi:hypothetical protein B5807_06430 [Epicoccum nigrum]|uniref:Uncharacterized protein n=1 Tax=Epicoccum nigrum TaxID=105696 RepID=A0A1Y2LY79_EPING|nr:hypothetical protein B5807_06430 [Epicoccum nigrum]
MPQPRSLPHVQLQLQVAHYNAGLKAAEYKVLDSLRFEARESESRLRKENKHINELNQSLTAKLKGKTASEDKVLRSENDRLKEEVAHLRAQLETKAAESQQKYSIIASNKQQIADLTNDLAAEQAATHHHDACNELEATLREGYDMFSLLNEDLEEKVKTLTAERDDFQSKLKSVTETQQNNLTENVPFECDGTPDCTSCVPHLQSALHSARAEGARALKWIDMRNHRINAWTKFSEQQNQVAHDRHADVRSWVTTQRAPSTSFTLVSSTCGSVPKVV